MSGWMWFILGALWMLGILLAWMLMRASYRHRQPDHMSQEWLQQRRKFKEEQ